MRTLVFAALAALAACSPSTGSTPAGAPAPGLEWPTRGWASSTPEREGMDAAALGALDAEFASGKRGQITSMLVIRHGRVVFAIGSDLGLAEGLRREARLELALSRLTLPHQLARLILLEQPYRALDLAAGGPYHRGDGGVGL